MSKAGDVWRKIHGKIIKRPTNFSWIVKDSLAGSGMPTSINEFDWILQQGVKSIITMTEEPLPKNWTSKINYLHVPTPDLTAPDIDKIEDAVDFIQEQILNNEKVMVHCAAGLGRAGTILACYLIKYHRYTTRGAINKIRKERPGSIQSENQEMAISFYEKHVSG